ncbi:MAG: polymerase, sigma-24 subunit, ecf subfamily protein [Bacteroidota bacterium]|jgi:RNA polymerase sigma-70 factor (ECF subfamily)
MNLNIEELIVGCKNKDASAQKQLYNQYKSVLFSICRRYINVSEDAEDVLIEAFVKIFEKVEDYKSEGSFEGWMKRIAVNEALMFLRKKRKILNELSETHYEISEEPHYDDEFDELKILELFDKLPDGYRTILNLYVVEGYKHKEIAEILGISINTSKSQLILARKRMQDIIKSNLGVKSQNQ